MFKKGNSIKVVQVRVLNDTINVCANRAYWWYHGLRGAVSITFVARFAAEPTNTLDHLKNPCCPLCCLRPKAEPTGEVGDSIHLKKIK